MKITTKLTLAYLKKNKKRTAVTLTTIAIVTILITILFSVISSFRQYMVDLERNDKNWEAEFIDIRYKDALEIAKEDNIKEISVYYDYGYSDEDVGKYDMKEKRFDENQLSFLTSHFYMRAYDDNAIKNAHLKIENGRMPQNPNEIVLTVFQPMSSDEDGNNKLAFEVGTELELTFEGKKKTYKVVGLVEALEEENSNFNAGPITQGAITYLDKDMLSEDTAVNVRVLTNNVKEVKNTAERIVDKLDLNELPNKNREIEQEESEFITSFKEKVAEEMGTTIAEDEEYNAEKVVYNTDLLRCELVTDVDNKVFLTLLYVGFTLIITFVAIIVIYTSFKMTYNDRIKDLGILSSVRYG